MTTKRPSTETSSAAGEASVKAQPRVVGRTLIRQGAKFDFELVHTVRPSGKTLDREIVRHPGAVVVVPILEATGGKQVVLIRNFRVSVGKPLVECCAGTIERPRVRNAGVGASGGESAGFGDGEAPEPCAARELIEETGYQAATLVPLGAGWFYTSPGLSDEQMFAFAATGLTHVGQDLEEDESIEVVIVPAQEAVSMALRGDVVDAKSMLAILLADRAGLLR